MIAALVVQKFNVKDHGTARNVEVARVLDLPAVPLHGHVLAFEDGTGEAGVSAVRLRAWPSPRPTGAYPVSVDVRTGTEPGERLPAALEAGWTAVG